MGRKERVLRGDKERGRVQHMIDTGLNVWVCVCVCAESARESKIEIGFTVKDVKYFHKNQILP